MSTSTSTGKNQREPLGYMVRLVLRDLTPVRLRLFLVANSLIAALFAIVATHTVGQHRHALQTVGKDAAPSVVAAHEMQIDAFQMDGRLADELLTDDKDIAALMVGDFEKGRQSFSKNLLFATRNITYGKAEQVPIENIQTGLVKYAMQAQRARDLNVAAAMPDETVAGYRTAYDTMANTLSPNMRALNKANRDILEDIYASEKSRSALTCGFVLLIGIVLLCVLGVTQIYLRKQFRRRLNVPLLIASLLTVVCINHMNSQVRESAEMLKLAKEDSYDSIFALLSIQSSIYAANAAQSRFLLDPAHAAQYQKDFDDSLSSIAEFAQGHDFESAIEFAEKELGPERRRLNVPGLSGSLADEFANIEYAGEGRAALDTMIALNRFVLADKRMRELDASGQHEQAVKVCLGYEPGRIKSSFIELNEALDRALSINQEHFDRQIVNANEKLAGLSLLSKIFAASIVFCVYLGLSPRMREYQ